MTSAKFDSNLTDAPPSANVMVDGIADAGLVVVPGFLDEDLRRSLRHDAEKSALAPAGIGRAAQLQRDERIRSDSIAWLDGSTPAQQRYLALMEQLRLHINAKLFLGLFDYECHYARYQPGQFYRRHRDAFAGSEQQPHARVLTTICYLNDTWSPEDAGELVIYGDEKRNDEHDDEALLQPGAELQKIAPQPGTLVVFLAERFPHEVLASKATRYSVTGWFRRS